MKLIFLVSSFAVFSAAAQVGLAEGISAEISWQHRILADAIALYEPLARSQGQKLVVEEDPAGPLVVASANVTFTEHKVSIQRGMIQSPRLTADALRMTICHELGHIYGGAPRRYAPQDWDEGPVAEDGLSVMSAEGQADYYAAMVCFRRMVAGQDHQQILAKTKIPAEVTEKCGKSWGEDRENNQVCQRSMIAALDFLNMVKEFSISFSTPDVSVASKLDRGSYPMRQCRLDTFVAGSLCRDSHGLQLDKADPTKSECTQAEAKRPLCWYPL